MSPASPSGPRESIGLNSYSSRSLSETPQVTETLLLSAASSSPLPSPVKVKAVSRENQLQVAVLPAGNAPRPAVSASLCETSRSPGFSEEVPGESLVRSSIEMTTS